MEPPRRRPLLDRGGFLRLSAASAAAAAGGLAATRPTAAAAPPVSEEANVGGVVSKVALGSADADFVYVTDAGIARRRVAATGLPTYAQPPIRYDLCVVRRRGADTRGAADFVRRVLSPRGRQLLRAGGFGLPRG